MLKIFISKFIFRGRIRHGRHFTFKAADGSATITFVAPCVTGILVSDDKPIVAQGKWLHVLVPNSFLDTMESSLKFLREPFTVITLINIFFDLLMIKYLYLTFFAGTTAKNHQLA